ncbi:sugar-binding domain-containing protein [Streptomyces shenzhenensis]|uniref:sugar-binding domain-containing protein n=1 Tax=Streptomyces shenzhenensis TaxID=943815 RepID=UPI00340EA980
MLDLATPAFDEVGVQSERREAFWYRRTFTVDGDVPEVAVLRIGKAMHGSKVFLNGREIGEHQPNFTAGHFDLAGHVRAEGAPNELVVRVGAWRDATPPSVANGFDLERYRSIPGIYDSVELTLTAHPYIQLVRTRPNLAEGSVTVFATIANGADPVTTAVDCAVTEAGSGRGRGHGAIKLLELRPFEVREVEVTVGIDDVRLWSPDNPFLYRLVVRTSGDETSVRFGMRSFTFDRDLGKAILNGEPYPLRGTNSAFFRFLEDPTRSDHPWREEWVRKLHRQFKAMHWNMIRYSIGFPPELWYEIADEEGLLILDEFPLFYPLPESAVTPQQDAPALDTPDLMAELNASSPEWASAIATGTPWPKELTAERLEVEYREWVEERANHACVVAWSAQCECATDATGKAVTVVRDRDPQRRPWGNGWGGVLKPDDYFDAHWYPEPSWHMRGAPLGTAGLATTFKTPLGFSHNDMAALADPRSVMSVNGHPNTEGHAILTAEYGWSWLNRDGSPTILSAPIYRRLTDAGWPTKTAEDRRYTRARILAAQTEFLRANRTVAGVMHFCGLASSHPRAFTSDNFVDLESLEFEPNYARYVRDAFSPLGVMVDFANTEVPAGSTQEVPVTVINDTAEAWRGRVHARLLRGDRTVWTSTKAVRLGAVGQDRVYFYVAIPRTEETYQIQAELTDESGRVVRSLRDFRTRAE